MNFIINCEWFQQCKRHCSVNWTGFIKLFFVLFPYVVQSDIILSCDCTLALFRVVGSVHRLGFSYGDVLLELILSDGHYPPL
jgi:hypothetical protein